MPILYFTSISPFFDRSSGKTISFPLNLARRYSSFVSVRFCNSISLSASFFRGGMGTACAKDGSLDS